MAAAAPGFEVRAALLNLGAAHVAAAGDAPLTFTAAPEAVEVARAMPSAIFVPLHFEAGSTSLNRAATSNGPSLPLA